MSKKTSQTGELFNPFPGLRPFTQDEAHLFFGREGQSKSVLNSLEENSFVAVIGASGSGKSSLIYCGVIPELKARSEKIWKAVTTRPGLSPVKNLVEAVGGSFPEQHSDDLAEKIIKGDLSIDDWLKGLLSKGSSLLLVIDQFEEIFRFKTSAASEQRIAEVSKFVELIHTSAASTHPNVSVVLTMRSDFIGECSVFQDLTDLINKSNYLIPQMTREDFRKAIEGPVKIGGAKLEEDLVEQLLDEVGIDTDQLPVLQHALMRTWDYWMRQNDPEKLISIGDYEAIGRMEKALSDHANEAFDELNEEQRQICEKLFKALTEKGGDNRGVRRPATVKRVAEISKSSAEEIIRIAEVFRIKGRTFLTPYQPFLIEDDSMIDISHESLMRIWDRLRLWVDEEASSVQMYNRLSEASALYQAGTTGLWRPPDLQLALNWREKQQPTSTWAVQYNPAFERAMVYLDTSESEFKKEEENKIRVQRRRLRVTRIFSLVLGGIAVIAVGLFLWTRDLRSDAESNLVTANMERGRAEEQRIIAEENAKVAERQTAAAEDATAEALAERQKALEATIEAERQADLAMQRQAAADRSAKEAIIAQALAQKNAEAAEAQRSLADSASKVATNRRMLSIAKSMAVKSLQIDKDDDVDLKGLLAFQAYQFNIRFGGPMHETDVYSGLYDARKALLGEQYNLYGGHAQSVNSIVFKKNDDEFISAGSDGMILIHSIKDTAKNYSVFDARDLLIQALAISKDGKVLASATKNNGIFIYDINSLEKEPVILPAHGGQVRDVIFGTSPDIIYSIGTDKKILKWSISSKTSEQIAVSGTRFNDIALSPDGNFIAASNRAGSILFIDLNNLEKQDSISGSASNPVFSLDFSKNGLYLAAGDMRGNVRIIDAKSHTQLNSLRGSSARIMGVRFSANNSYLASSSLDGKVLMWEMADLNNSPIVMENLKDYVFSVEFSPDEKYLISGSKSIKVGPVSASQLADGFCSMLNRNFTSEEWEIYVGNDIDFMQTCPLLVTEN